MVKSSMTSAMVHRLEGQRRLEQLILRGVYNVRDLSLSLGVTQQTVYNWMKEVRERWKTERPEDLDELKAQRRTQLDYLYSLGVNGFHESRLGPQYEREVVSECQECGGEGEIEERPGEMETCGVCKGSGMVTDTEIRQDPRPGDVSFLRFAKEALVEMMKIEGFANGGDLLTSRQMLSESKMVGGVVYTKTQELFMQSGPEAVMQARTMFAEMEERAAGREHAITYEHNQAEDT